MLVTVQVNSVAADVTAAVGAAISWVIVNDEVAKHPFTSVTVTV